MSTINTSAVHEFQSYVTFLTWLQNEHKITFGRQHTHTAICYRENNMLACGRAPENFEPLCISPEALVTLFFTEARITDPRQSLLRQLEANVKNAELRVRRFPDEQEVMRALNAWQPHPDLRTHSDCAPETCFCCDAARTLAMNKPFMSAMHSIAEQIETGEAYQMDALTSAFAFGLWTAQFMQVRAKDVIQ